jgi:hypothetical protein
MVKEREEHFSCEVRFSRVRKPRKTRPAVPIFRSPLLLLFPTFHLSLLLQETHFTQISALQYTNHKQTNTSALMTSSWSCANSIACLNGYPLGSASIHALMGPVSPLMNFLISKASWDLSKDVQVYRRLSEDRLPSYPQIPLAASVDQRAPLS